MEKYTLWITQHSLVYWPNNKKCSFFIVGDRKIPKPNLYELGVS